LSSNDFDFVLDGWSPPEDILITNIPNGAHWYEIRCPVGCYPYPVQDYDDAMLNVKHIKSTFGSGALYYCWKEAEILQGYKVI